MDSIDIIKISQNPVIYCQVISKLMTRDRYALITRCLHVANAPPSATDKSSPSYDKMHKIRWMLDKVCDRYKAMWAPNNNLLWMKVWSCTKVCIVPLGNTCHVS